MCARVLESADGFIAPTRVRATYQAEAAAPFKPDGTRLNTELVSSQNEESSRYKSADAFRDQTEFLVCS